MPHVTITVVRSLLFVLLAVSCSKSGASSKGADTPTELGTTGRLPPDTVQAILRSHYGIFRKCYEAGLARNPKLKGRVTVRFVIDRDGRVSLSDLVKSTLGDEATTSCVVDGYRRLRFPKPDGGVVTVVYPVHFSPG
jgi:TonB family protein